MLSLNDELRTTPVMEEAIERRMAEGRTIKGGWRNVAGVVLAGVALMCDGYQNNLMTTANLVFDLEYPKVYTSGLSTRVSNSLLIGEIVGMLVIGLTCDFIGRKAAMILTTGCIVVGGILATAAHGTTTLGMFWMIIVMRGLVGFGTGGEYPTSSTMASEAANQSVRKRGRTFVLVTNLPLSLGGPFCLIVFLIVWVAAGGEKHLSTVWRTIFGIGCIWPFAIFCFRLKLINNEMYTKGRFMDWRAPWLLILRYYWKRLVGTCGAWFMYDFITFPNGIFSATIIKKLVGADKVADPTRRTAEWQLLLGVIAIPGVIVGAFLCDRIGRKWTCLIGFSGYLVFGLVVGCAYEPMSKIVPLFVVFYGLFTSMGNLGPGNMMGLTSTECYSTAVRGTLYGLSAAVGKAGAAVGTQVFLPIENNLGQRYTFIIAACVGVVGMIITFFFIPHLREDDLMLEDLRFQAYLREHGYTGKFGEEPTENETDSSADISEEAESKNKNATVVRVVSS